MARCVLEPNSTAPARGRAFLREHAHGAPDRFAVAELLLSELVTNTVLHTSSAPEVRITRAGNGSRIAVHDHSRRMPTRRDRGGPDGGWGLQIVAALADRWGMTKTSTGKVVWFEIDGVRVRRRRANATGSPRRRRPSHRSLLHREADSHERKADNSGV